MSFSYKEALRILFCQTQTRKASFLYLNLRRLIHCAKEKEEKQYSYWKQDIWKAEQGQEFTKPDDFEEWNTEDDDWENDISLKDIKQFYQRKSESQNRLSMKRQSNQF